jgi:diguanylate cyclase (GGDEF)-like protein
VEEAYDALARGAELEREALREFSRLQLGLERARLEASATRREADALGVKNRQLEALLAELADAHEQLRDQADRDWLTGVHNRRYLARAGDGLAVTRPGPVSLAVIDLDHFKSINDRYGHQVGDRVLVRVARLIEAHVRSEDIVVRTGGEEFAVLMPASRGEEAAACCERLRAMIGDEPWADIAPGLAVTASIGVVSVPGGADIGDLERIADERLYAAKRAGRDRVVAGPLARLAA